MSDQKFFVGLKAFVDKNGEVLILFDDFVGLDFPGGKIQVGEKSLESSLKREVKEETGIDISVGKPFVAWKRIITKGSHIGEGLLLIGYRCKYIFGEVTLSQEHYDHKWVNKNNYINNNKKQAYLKYLEVYFKEA